jgi:Holliday junction DNA helicase RuvA
VIGFLNGIVAGRTADGCFLDVGGVGYRLSCSATTMGALPSDGRRIRLWTHTYVREEQLALFGFASEAEQHMFEALLTVGGVGPKVALAVCSAFTPDSFRGALATDDAASIATVPGIGKKTAQRIVIDLKERLSIPDLHVVTSGRDALAEARSALENLGYSPGEVRAALAEAEVTGEERVEDVIKTALKVLA